MCPAARGVILLGRTAKYRRTVRNTYNKRPVQRGTRQLIAAAGTYSNWQTN